jgi:hypothetical protein
VLFRSDDDSNDSDDDSNASDDDSDDSDDDPVDSDDDPKMIIMIPLILMILRCLAKSAPTISPGVGPAKLVPASPTAAICTDPVSADPLGRPWSTGQSGF